MSDSKESFTEEESCTSEEYYIYPHQLAVSVMLCWTVPWMLF